MHKELDIAITGGDQTMLKRVKDACLLHEKALEIYVGDQVEKLDELIEAEGDGQGFFEKTHVTKGMETLLREGLARLAGQSSTSIFHLKQAMGGGKTHLLIAFGLLAKKPDLRVKECSSLLRGKDFGVAKVAAFNGRNHPDKYFWGVIAEQLGKGSLFREYWANGPKAPDEEAWLKLFEGDEPLLVLLDEMPPYFHYYNAVPLGNGTLGDITTCALACMLVAAGKKSNVCVVISDLSATYDSGRKLINQALQDAQDELGRQARAITPVDLASNEVYDILRKRLFKSLPNSDAIKEVASEYGQALQEATKAKAVSQSAEAIADGVEMTYPFHPCFKHLIALFRENEGFQQTRGLMELSSRLLKSVWENDEDVYLIGPQHFDLSIPNVREALIKISEMNDVISKDIYDVNQSAHAQVFDLQGNTDACRQVASLLLMASLSTAAVNTVRGLMREEVIEYLVTPYRKPSEIRDALEKLDSVAWYLHHTSEGRYYFDRQENLTKLLQSLAANVPENKIDELIRDRLKNMFAPKRKTVYREVLPLPKLDDVLDTVRKNRVLLIVSPDSKIPPEEVARFFQDITQKNNLCVLTGDKTRMASIEEAARRYFAASQAMTRIEEKNPQREELEKKHHQYEQDLMTTILNLFDKVMFPIQPAGKEAKLVPIPLLKDWNGLSVYDGETQIEKTLTKDPIKLYLSMDDGFDAIRDKAEDLLWPKNQEEAPWRAILDALAEQPGMPWLPPGGLEEVKVIACNRGLWEDLGNGYVTKKPQKKKTSLLYVLESGPDDRGTVRLRLEPQNSGPAPRMHFMEDGKVSEQSPILKAHEITTSALRVEFLVVDPSGQYEKGDTVLWTNSLVLRNELFEEAGTRKVRLFLAPKGTIRYTLDATEPRNGKVYETPFEIGNDAALVCAFGECEGLEARKDFRFPPSGKKGLEIEDSKPVTLDAGTQRKKLDSSENVFRGLAMAKEKGIRFETVMLTVGSGLKTCQFTTTTSIDAEKLETILQSMQSLFEGGSSASMGFAKAFFPSGHDLKQFAREFGIEIRQGEVE